MAKLSNLEEKYCCGCGLCNNFLEGMIDEKGYFRPCKELDSQEFDKSVCYCNSMVKSTNKGLWGEIKEAYFGYSTDENIRKKASSGGILTALACYLLRKKEIDCVIQVKVNKNNPLTTETVWNTNENEVINCCGSRYTASASLIDILKKIEFSKKYVEELWLN